MLGTLAGLPHRGAWSCALSPTDPRLHPRRYCRPDHLAIARRAHHRGTQFFGPCPSSGARIQDTADRRVRELAAADHRRRAGRRRRGTGVFFSRTDLGLATLATSQEPTASRSSASASTASPCWSWGTGRAARRAAGVLLAPVTAQFQAGYGTTAVLIAAFTAAVVGGHDVACPGRSSAACSSAWCRPSPRSTSAPTRCPARTAWPRCHARRRAPRATDRPVGKEA